MRGTLSLALAAVFACSALAGPWKSEAAKAEDKKTKEWMAKNPFATTVPNRYFVRFEDGTDEAAREFAVKRAGGLRMKGFRVAPDVELVMLSLPQKQAMKKLMNHPLVASVTPEPIARIEQIPNDPLFGELWGMSQANNFDINAPEAWDVFTGNPNFVVAIMDTGINYNHEDLAANVWTNPGEIPGNGIDDEGNGYIDDVHGWNAVANNGNPLDDHSHGSHVAGTIGGVGNNSLGVAGVNWNVKMAAIKSFNSGGSAVGADILEGMDYIKANNFAMSNHSWAGTGLWTDLYNVMTTMQTAGHLFVCAAGNSSINVDLYNRYPGALDLDSIINVAAIQEDGARANFSNWGAVKVDLAAPGVRTLSAIHNGGYAKFSGTSMASPHVAGAAALLWGYHPGLSAADVKSRILANVTPIASMAGITVTGGLLNLQGLLTNADPTANAGTDQTVGATGTDASFELDATGSTDPENDALTYEWFEGGVSIGTGATLTITRPIGDHTFSVRATDHLGAYSDDSVDVSVTDAGDPTIENQSATPNSIWPPNHKMVDVSVSYTVSDNFDSAPTTWLTVSSSEADSGLGPDDVPNDIEVVDANTVRLRAERYADAGRTYTITIHAQDAAGNTSEATVTVTVPKSQGR